MQRVPRLVGEEVAAVTVMLMAGNTISLVSELDQ
jgi:hypothetical protein